jgi:hypothetical protein
MADQFTDTLLERVSNFLRARARLGFIGGVFEYTTEDKGPKALAVKADLEASGWTVVIDAPNRRVTIS